MSADPGHRHVVVPAWTIELRHGQTPLVLAGRITWVPGPSALPWLLLGLGLLVLTASLGLARRWGPPLSVALALLVAVDVVHSFARATSAGDPVAVMIAKVVFLGFGSTVAWVIGACSVGSLQQERELGLVGAGLAGFLMALFSGVSDAASLGRSQLPSGVPASASRAAIVAALGMGLGLAGAALVVARRHPELKVFRVVEADEATRSTPGGAEWS